MSDYTKPRTNLNDFLPAQLQSAFLKNINENLFNRFLTKDEYQHVVGIIGDADANNPLKQIIESTVYRQTEQLQPVASVTVGSETTFLTFQDYLQRLSRLDVDVTQFNEWGKTLQFNFAPPIDIDKLINYQDYYWNAPNINDVPDYITIKNEATWTSARSTEYKNTITGINLPSTITQVDAYNVTTVGNIAASFKVGDYILMTQTGNAGGSLINQITNIVLNTTTGITTISMLLSMGTATYNAIYNFSLAISSVGADNSFVVLGDLSEVFTQGYIFSTQSSLAVEHLWSTITSVFDVPTNSTKITVAEPVSVNDGWKTLSMLPMAALADAEYNSVVGDSLITYNAAWNDINIGSLIWDKKLASIEFE